MKSVLLEKPDNADKAESLLKLDEKIQSKLLEEQIINFSNEFETIMKVKNVKGTTAAAFKLKEKIFGSKKSEPDIVAINDPKTNTLVTNKDDVKNNNS